MQNAAKYNGIKLNGKYAVSKHIITANAVQTAAVVSFLVAARMSYIFNSNALRYTDSPSSNTRSSMSLNS